MSAFMSLLYHSYRNFSSRKKYQVNIVLGPLLPKGITNQPAFQKLWKKTQLEPVEVEEISVDNHANTINTLHGTYHVGYFDQYPQRSNQNCAVFSQNFISMYRMQKKQWRCNIDNSTINIKFPIDAYPFNQTYKKSKNKCVWKQDKKINLQSLGVNSKLDDTIDGNLPILVRKLDKKRKQTLLCWRDRHPDIKNIGKMETLIREYKPDLIILEYPISNEVLKPYYSVWYKYLIYPYLRIIQRLIPQRYELYIGNAFGKLTEFFKIPTAYATNAAMMMAIKDNINICLADYPNTLIDAMSYIVTVLDIYQSLLFGVNNKRIKQMQENRQLPEKLMNLLSTRMSPHMLSIGDLRNDLMTLAINESVEDGVDKILFVAGEMHWLDIRDKLCGETEIVSPFKEMTEEHLVLKSHNPLHYVGHSKISLTTEEIKQYIEVIGIQSVAILMIPQKNYKTNDEIEQAVNEWVTNWNDLHCKPN